MNLIDVARDGEFLVEKLVFLPQDLFVRGFGVLLLCEIETVNPGQVGPLFLENSELLPQGVQPRIGNEGLTRVVAPHHLVELQLALDAREDAVTRRMAQAVDVSQRQADRLRRGLDLVWFEEQEAHQQKGPDRVFHGRFGE